jgi:serine/threonine protein kinase
LKIIDFGTSIIKSKGNIKGKIGTPYYIAPEILNGV